MRKRWRIEPVLCLLLALGATLSRPVAADLPAHGFTDLGTLPDGDYSWPTDINNLGQIVGLAKNANGQIDGFLWDNSFGMRDLGTLPGAIGSWANDINDLGQIVGHAEFPNDKYKPVIWENGQIRALPTLPGTVSCKAVCINNLGEIFGWAATSTAFMTVKWQGNTVAAVDSLRDTGVVHVNDWGQVVGWYAPDVSYIQPFVWENDTLTLLPMPADAIAGYALSINNNGQIVGYLDYSTASYKDGDAAFWDNGILTILPRYKNSRAWGQSINDQGTILGGIDDRNRQTSVLVLWENGAIRELATGPIYQAFQFALRCHSGLSTHSLNG